MIGAFEKDNIQRGTMTHRYSSSDLDGITDPNEIMEHYADHIRGMRH